MGLFLRHMNLAALQSSTRRKISKDLTSVGYSDTNLNANLNEWYRTIVGWVIEAMGTMDFFGNTISWNLSPGVGSFTFPDEVVAFNRLEIDYSATDVNAYVVVNRVDEKSIPSALQNSSVIGVSTSHPIYRIFGSTIEVLPKPTVAVTNGLIAELIMDVTDLSGSASPVLNPLIHKALSVGAAFEYASAEQYHRLADRLERELFGSFEDDPKGLRYQVQMLAERFDRNVRQRIQPHRRSYR